MTITPKQPSVKPRVFESNNILMKQVGILFIFILTVCSAFAQESETRQLGKFTAIRVGEAIDLYLRKGDKESAKVEVENVKLSEVLTEISGSQLRIHMRQGNYQNRRSVKVTVTYVSINKIGASSASNVFGENTISAKTLDISASSAANIELNVEADEVYVDVGSAADITLEGKARKFRVEAGSAGSVDAYSFECEIVDASVSSAGSAKINVTKELDAEASSGGSIRYRGNPTNTNTDSSSGGSVKKSS